MLTLATVLVLMVFIIGVLDGYCLAVIRAMESDDED